MWRRMDLYKYLHTLRCSRDIINLEPWEKTLISFVIKFMLIKFIN